MYKHPNKRPHHRIQTHQKGDFTDILISKAVGSRKLRYQDMITRDTGVDQNDLPTMMADRNCWREVVLGVSAQGER